MGESLGRKHSAPCRSCGTTSKPAGFHPSAECPLRWGKEGTPLPGFRADGSRESGAWTKNGKEPIKATIQAWINFVEDVSNWRNVVPVAAGVQGGVTLEDFKRRLALAPVKP